jgi:thiol-disulfide isomerase/thioredoxin
MKNTIITSIVLAVLLPVVGIALTQQSSSPTPPNPDQAPLFAEGQWLNVKDGKPVTLESRKGKPTLVAFWTFACSNCHANLPVYRRLLEKYRAKGVEMISIHTPELKIEHDLGEVKKHIEKFKIDYPVLIDNENKNWNRWKVNVWPTLFVVDGKGIVRYHWKGELNWRGAGGEAKIGEILDELLAKER